MSRNFYHRVSSNYYNFHYSIIFSLKSWNYIKYYKSPILSFLRRHTKLKHSIFILICILSVLGATACSTDKPIKTIPELSTNEDTTKDNETSNGDNEASEDVNETSEDVNEVSEDVNESSEDVNEASEDDNAITYEYTDEGIIKPEIAEAVIKETSDKVIKAIEEKDMTALSKFIHPDKGVRFTPYTNVSNENDLVFTKEQMLNFFEDNEKYVWGYYDGRGNEILLSPSEYYEEFIYSENFIDAEKVGYNMALGGGNIIENQFIFYENPIVVEYYFSGFKPEYDGLDWQSLRLVFQEKEGTWYLVGIIHNQYTI